ncbi:MAG: hypothetical protein H0W15_03350 [Gemmatimonadales bacterium]|nr:hypothetical protein [Gemmatimonadales bacterium]
MRRAILPATLTAALLTGCGGFPAPQQPAPAAYAPASATSASAWAANHQLAGRSLLRFKWQYRDERSSAGGNGSIRLTAPDSLRLDFRGPLGSGRGAAAVIGSTTIWADPQEDVDKFVPNFHLLWGMLGVILVPQAGDIVETADDGRVTAWRYISGADTVDYLRTLTGKPQLLTDVRSQGKRIGRALTTFDAQGHPATVRLDVPSAPARLDLTFTAVTVPDAHPDGTWDAPRSDP